MVGGRNEGGGTELTADSSWQPRIRASAMKPAMGRIRAAILGPLRPMAAENCLQDRPHPSGWRDLYRNGGWISSSVRDREKKKANEPPSRKDAGLMPRRDPLDDLKGISRTNEKS
jgi:hypothetical protein